MFLLRGIDLIAASNRDEEFAIALDVLVFDFLLG